MEHDSTKARNQLARLMLLAGVLGLIFGTVHLLSYVTSGSAMALADAGINTGIGLLALLAGWLVREGKLIAILVAVVMAGISMVYSLLVGRGVNVVSLVVTVAFVVWMIVLWRRGALT